MRSAAGLLAPLAAGLVMMLATFVHPAASDTAPATFDANQVDTFPVNTWIRTSVGPEVTRQIAIDYSTCPAPWSSAAPVARPYTGYAYGGGLIFYFGGGHSGYSGNDVEMFDVTEGRWRQSTYAPECGRQVRGGGLGPREPTPGGRPWWGHLGNRMAWDAKRQRFVILDNAGLWEFEPATSVWAHVIMSPPPVALTVEYLDGALAYDPTLQTILYLAGSAEIYKPDYTKKTWERYASPPAGIFTGKIYQGGNAYDSRQRLHIYAKSSDSLYSFDAVARRYARMSLTNGPSRFIGSAITYDALNGEVLVPAVADGKLDLWSLKHSPGQPDQWRRLDINGPGPTPNTGHNFRFLQYDAVKQVIWVPIARGGGANGNGGTTPGDHVMWALKYRPSR